MTRIVTKSTGVFVLDDKYTILREVGNKYESVFMYFGVLSKLEREQSMDYMILAIPKTKELTPETLIAAADIALNMRAEHEASLFRKK